MKLLRIALLIAFPSLIFAQTNYHQGYVLKNNGDTLKGYIDYREWTYSPLIIDFKVNKTDNSSQQFTPETIKGFEITGMETYTSYVGVVSTNKNIFPNIPVGLDTGKVRTGIFLRQLATGDHLTLFYNNEVNKDRFFISESAAPPIELMYFEYYDNTRTQEVYHNLYRGQLLVLANKFNTNNQKLKNDIEELNFEQQAIVQVVDEINNVSFEKKEISSNQENKKSNVRVFGGIGINSIGTTYSYVEPVITVSSNNIPNVNDVVHSYHKNTITPKFDLGIDIFINPNVQQFIVRIGLSYYSVSGSFRLPSSSAIDLNSDLQYSQYSFAVTPQFLFNVYNKDKFKIYIDCGLSLCSTSYSNNMNGNLDNAVYQSFSGYVPIQAGVVFNKKLEIYFTYASFTTSASYNEIAVSNKLSKGFGLKVFFN